jgi:outer membrane immunogenic protein
VRKSFLCVTVLLAFGVAGARADEMTSAPSFYITGPTTSQHWTGVYVGINGGYGWANSTVSYQPNDPAAQNGTCGGVGHGQCIPTAPFDVDGSLVGGQVGFNWQINALWLAGVEADYQWSKFEGSGTSVFHLGNVGTTSVLVNESVKSFGTVRARTGVIATNALFLYGTAGIAFGSVNENFSVPNPVAAGMGSVSAGGFSYLCAAGGPPCFAGSSSKTMLGWTAGAGAEYAITNNLSLKAEFLYVNFGVPGGTVVAQSAVAGTVPSSFAASTSPVTVIAARAGLNFKFDWAAAGTASR